MFPRRALNDRDYQVGIADFKNWEQEHGRIEDGAIILLNTGYGRFWPDREKYMGTAERGADAVQDLHFPGLDPDAARWLVDNRNIMPSDLTHPASTTASPNILKAIRSFLKATFLHSKMSLISTNSRLRVLLSLPFQ